jgi:hypothetical protein
MSTYGNEPGGIHARRIEADNVVAGVQIQRGDAQITSELVQLAQPIRQGTIIVPRSRCATWSVVCSIVNVITDGGKMR